MATIDLHIHSTHSDGSYSPEEIAQLAHHNGLSAIALTDHDTVSGVHACQEAGKALELTVLSGIELSTSYDQLELHLLGYGFDAQHPLLTEQLSQMAHARLTRTHHILQKLSDCGISLSLEDLCPGAGPTTIITRAHFASALLAKGHVQYQKQAFDRYLGYGKPAYVSKEELPSISSAIQLIHAAGGVALLAHPTLYRLNRDRTYSLIHNLMALGLDGLECYYPSYTPSQTRDFLRLCKNNQLLCSGGSDFHGKTTPHISLGTGYGNLAVPDSCLTAFEHLTF